jgi:hypothetical protein
MSWRTDKVDVNNGKGGSRWVGREIAKQRSKMLRRKWDKFLTKQS